MWPLDDSAGNRFDFGQTDSRIEAVGRGGSVRVWALNSFEDAY
jgi:hypothetical protein